MSNPLNGISGSIDLPIRRDMTYSLPPRYIIDHENGKSAQTNWKVLEKLQDRTRLMLHPITGRSHQLRVHLRSIGHSIIGDPIYGNIHDSRMYLHAHQLALAHPTKGGMLELTSRVPF